MNDEAKMLAMVSGDEDMLGKKSQKLEELMELLVSGMGDDMKSRYMPAPEPAAEDAESLLAQGEGQADEGGDEPSEEELLALLQGLV